MTNCISPFCPGNLLSPTPPPPCALYHPLRVISTMLRRNELKDMTFKLLKQLLFFNILIQFITIPGSCPLKINWVSFEHLPYIYDNHLYNKLKMCQTFKTQPKTNLLSKLWLHVLRVTIWLTCIHQYACMFGNSKHLSPPRTTTHLARLGDERGGEGGRNSLWWQDIFKVGKICKNVLRQ